MGGYGPYAGCKTNCMGGGGVDREGVKALG